jgi:hypothetical protein
MRLILLAMAGFSVAALAEEPAELVWTVKEIESLRYFDADFVGPTFQKGDELEVVIRHEGLVRVYADGRFGWLPEDAVTLERPAVLSGDFAARVEKADTEEADTVPSTDPGAEAP